MESYMPMVERVGISTFLLLAFFLTFVMLVRELLKTGGFIDRIVKAIESTLADMAKAAKMSARAARHNALSLDVHEQRSTVSRDQVNALFVAHREALHLLERYVPADAKEELDRIREAFEIPTPK